MSQPNSESQVSDQPMPQGRFSRTIKSALKSKTSSTARNTRFIPENAFSPTELIERFRQGDNEVLKSVYLAHFPSVEHFVQRNNGSTEEAKDVFQDAMLVVFQKLSQPDFTLTCQLGTFIYAVASRLWQKKLRDERPIALLTTGAVDDLVSNDLDNLIRRMQRFKLYETKFAALSPGCQAILKDFLQGKSTAEVMKEFGFGSISYTKKRKCICKGKLIKLIMEDPEFKELTQDE